ncbi:hypothetical protein GCM10023144_23130 [Pigmentiphaga soli]|uniref:DUF2384 domain-containing protein n=1 Tax=Pigmentiphaga soli TaxID=1007095 RepID=A0ABP8H1M3_9BURK
MTTTGSKRGGPRRPPIGPAQPASAAPGGRPYALEPAREPHMVRDVGMAYVPAEPPAAVEDFVRIYRSDPMDRIHLIRKGVSAEWVSALAAAFRTSRDKVVSSLGLPRSTIGRKARQEEALPRDQSERLVRMWSLIGQVIEMVEESGDPDGFDAVQWLWGWLNRPNAALGNTLPSELLDTVEGLEIVAGLLAKMQSGAYA